jgi:hypothetical protein
MHRLGSMLPLAVYLLVFVGCSSQPLGPSSASAPAAAPAATGGNAGTATLNSAAGGRPAALGVVYVTGQRLYYDTFVTVDPLPMRGRFQPIGDSDGDGIPETPYGPGDRGYLGGRWWADVNDNGMQDSGDHFFLCPLLGPGRPTP